MIKEDIKKALITAMKSRNELEVRVLRFILSQINYAEIEKQKELVDEEIIFVLQKELKKRKEAIELFKKGNRNDLVTDEEKQLKILERYLPAQMSEEELEKIIDQIISETSDKSNIGKIIGKVMGQVKGKAEGVVVAGLVKEIISS